MTFMNPYWNSKDKIELLQKWLLVHSAIYYDLNDNIVTDSIYDSNSNQLKALMLLNKTDSNKSKWAKAFKGYEHISTTSGFDLLKRLNKNQRYEIIELGRYLIKHVV